MTIQEEMQSYMRGWLKYAQGTYDDEGIDYALKEMTVGLDSQGVVIKVDRELPEILAKCCCETHPELAEMGEVGDGQYHACEDYQERMLEAGYVAVEPLEVMNEGC